MKGQQITAAQRRAVMERDGGRCRRCGASVYGRAYSIHHRRTRGMGGTRNPATLAELVLLCGTGSTGCHGEITENPSEAYATGWCIRRTDPHTADMIPVLTLTGDRIRFTDGGDVVVIPS